MGLQPFGAFKDSEGASKAFNRGPLKASKAFNHGPLKACRALSEPLNAPWDFKGPQQSSLIYKSL